jgi:hypothetical protein
MPQPEMGTIGSYTGAVGMIAFPPDGVSAGLGGVPQPLIEYANDGIAWLNEVGMVQAGYEKEQFRPMGMAVIPGPDPLHQTGLNQFGESTIDRWHEVCGGLHCGPAESDAANSVHDERVQDPPPQDVCACGIYTEDNYDPVESKQEEVLCSGLVQMRRGPNVVGPFGLLQSVADALTSWKGSIIFVSHDTEFVEELQPTKVLLMPDGQVDYFSPDWLELVDLA